MDHKQDNETKKDTIDVSNDSDSSDLNQEQPLDTQKDTQKDTQNTAPKNTKKSRSGLGTIISIALLIIIGLLFFAYYNNLAGFKSITHKIYHTVISYNIPIQDTAPKKEIKIVKIQSQAPLQKEKPPQPIHIKHSITANTTDQPKVTSKAIPILDVGAVFDKFIKDSSDPKEVTKKIITEKNAPLKSEPTHIAQKSTHKDESNKNTQHPTSTGLRALTGQFMTLQDAINSGDPYLNILIDLKTQLKHTKIALPILTEYASGGFPTDIIIVTDATKALKRLAIMQSRKKSANTFEDIIGKFIIVTPTSNIKGFSGALYDIKKALNDADFDAVLNKINNLSEKKQKSFSALKGVIEDKKQIHIELKKFNDAIIDDVFTYNR